MLKLMPVFRLMVTLVAKNLFAFYFNPYPANVGS